MRDLCGSRTPVRPDKGPMSLTSFIYLAVYGWLALTGVGVEKGTKEVISVTFSLCGQ
jgi:hypothetical protein